MKKIIYLLITLSLVACTQPQVTQDDFAGASATGSAQPISITVQ